MLNKLFAGLGSVHMVKNCDLGLENAFTVLQPSLQIIQLKP